MGANFNRYQCTESSSLMLMHSFAHKTVSVFVEHHLSHFDIWKSFRFEINFAQEYSCSTIGGVCSAQMGVMDDIHTSMLLWMGGLN